MGSLAEILASASAAAAESRRPAASLRVLLAEDNAVNQRLVCRLLNKRNCRVDVVSDGSAALAALEAKNYDVVLMDVQMPVMDGFEATAAIREKERHTGGHQWVIALTAHAMKGDEARCLAAGMDSYLAKPIRSHELFGLLDKCGCNPCATAPSR